MTGIIIFIIVSIVVILVLRALGAWMLRIDEVIKGLKSIDKTLGEIKKQLNEKRNDKRGNNKPIT